MKERWEGNYGYKLYYEILGNGSPTNKNFKHKYKIKQYF